MKKMKAVVYEKFGPPEVLEIREIDKPTPGDNEVLIRVHATSVNAAECNGRGRTHIPKGLGLLAKLMMGFKKPKNSILGSSFAGEIEAIGQKVTLFKVGDHVFGSGPQLGAYAEYTCRPETGPLVTMPSNISHEQAASVPYGALTALYFLRDKGKIESGQKVLINGASGDVGIMAVQLARYFNCEITGVCSTANIDLVKSNGADKVIDYTKEDFASSGEKWDLIMDIVVGQASFSRCKNSLNPGGYYLAVAGGLGALLQMIWTSIAGNKKVVFGGGEACEKKENLAFLKELIQAEKLKLDVDRIFPLEEIVEAHQYYETRNAKGSVSIAV